MPKSLPSKFELSLDAVTAKAITNVELDEIAKLTDAKVLVDMLKLGIKDLKRPGAIGQVSEHYKASWSYSS